MPNMMLTTAQAAEKLGISPRRVLELIKGGRLPAQPFGRTYMIQEKDLALVKNRRPGRPKIQVAGKKNGRTK
jgi:excisionase family DNA binding protein